MLDLKFVASVAERDIDLLMMEELSVSEEFQMWLASRVFGEPIYQSNLGAWHSVTDSQLGESDLVFIFESINGSRIAVLIENKIDAPPQPQQGERYRLRGVNGLEEGYWDAFKTCVVAPARYLNSVMHSESYDIEISYEELLAYFQSRSIRSQRFSYKAKIILEGIEQNRRGYIPKFHPEMTQFVDDYYHFCTNTYGQLCPQKPKPRPAGSTWIMFYPKSLPREINLAHQLTSGFVKAFFRGKADSFEQLKGPLESILPSDAVVELAGKSVAVIIDVPKVDPLNVSFIEQQMLVRQALERLAVLESVLTDVDW